MTLPRAEPITKQRWTCRNCGRMLGEIVGSQIIIIVHNRRLYLSATQWAAQNCPHCGALNERDGRPADERRVTA